MEQEYLDDPNQQNQQQVVQPQTPTSSFNVMDFLKNNSHWVILAAIIVAGLIWWFYFRDGKKRGDGSNDINSCNQSGDGYIGVTRTRT